MRKSTNRLLRFTHYLAAIRVTTDFLSLKNIFIYPDQSVLFSDLDGVIQNAAGIKLPNGYTSKNIHCKQSGYGSDAWFSTQISKISLRSAKPSDNQYRAIVTQFAQVQPYVHQYLTHDLILETFHAFHNMQLSVFGLSMRGYSEVVYQKLNQLGIHFSTPIDFPIKIGEHEKAIDKAIYFSHGIIYCSGASKSDCLHLFLNVALREKWVSPPVDTIGFIDDNMQHCTDVYTAITKRHWHPCVFHYPYVKSNIPTVPQEEMDRDAVEFQRFLNSVTR